MPRPPPTIHKKSFVCVQCNGTFRSNAGRTRHINAKHSGFPAQVNSPQSDNFSEVSSRPGSLSPAPPSSIFDSPPRSDDLNLSDNIFNFGNGDTDITPPLSPSRDTASMSIEYHPYLSGKMNNMSSPLDIPDTFIGKPCNEDGDLLNPVSPPITETRDPTDWTPFRNRVEFEMAEFLYKRCQMSGSNIDTLMELWAAFSALRDPEDVSPLDRSPFSTHRDLYSTIDAIQIGGVPWQSITLSYDGPIPESPPSWMKAGQTVWFRDPRLLFKKMLENPDFQDSFDYAPYRQYDSNGERRYEHFMSGDWVWKQSVSARSCFTLPQCIKVSPRI